MKKLENVVIKVIVSVIIKVVFNLVVIVKVEYMFRICSVIGLLLNNGFNKICLIFLLLVIF